MTEAEHFPAQSSIILLRIHDYSRRPVAEQARLNAQLDTVLALLLPLIPPRMRIVLSGNGSAALAVLRNPSAALSFAERALNAGVAGLALCIGIDHGPVEVVSGDSGEMLSGDGVATASLMAASAPEGTLLVSQNFRIALAQMRPGAESALVTTGNISDAGLRTYQVYGLDRTAPTRRRRGFALVAGITALLILSTAMALRLWMPDRPRPLAPYFEKPLTTVIERPMRSSHGKP